MDRKLKIKSYQFDKLNIGLMLGLLITLISFTLIFRIERKLDEDHYKNFSQKVSKMMVYNFESYLHPLQGLKSFYYAEKFNVSSSKHRRFALARGLYSNFPGSLGFGFIRKIQKIKIDAYLNQMRSERKNFNLRRLEDERAQVMDTIFVIELIEPVERNLGAVGLVVSDELHRQDAALYSMRTGLPALTNSIQLVQANKVEPGFLLYLPMYDHSDTPKDENERLKLIQGWVYAPILASSVIQDALSRIGDDYRLQVIEFEKKDQKIIFDSGTGKNEGVFQSKISSDLFFGGQHWRIEVADWKLQTTFAQRFLKHKNSLGILFLGILFSFMIYFLLRSLRFESKTKESNKFKDLLKARGDYLNKILDKVPESISYWNNDWTLGFCNENFKNSFLQNNEISFISQKMSDSLQIDLFCKIEFYVPMVLNGEPVEFELDFEMPINSFYLAKMEPDMHEGKVMGFLLIMINISDVKKLQNDQKIFEARLIEKSKLSLLGEMAGGVAHEINNPLAIIKGSAQILKKSITAVGSSNIDLDKAERNIQKILETSERIARIVKGLRSFSRDAENDVWESFEVVDVVNDAMALCEEKFKAHGIKFFVEFTINEKIYGNKVEISQVLVNLMSNSYDAISSMEEKWIKIEVLNTDDQKIAISVTDSGLGIDPNIQSKLMQPFFTTKEIGKGTGLGLSISIGIAKKHGGNLYLDNQSPHTKFVFVLPEEKASLKSA